MRITVPLPKAAAMEAHIPAVEMVTISAGKRIEATNQPLINPTKAPAKSATTMAPPQRQSCAKA